MRAWFMNYRGKYPFDIHNDVITWFTTSAGQITKWQSKKRNIRQVLMWFIIFPLMHICMQACIYRVISRTHKPLSHSIIFMLNLCIYLQATHHLNLVMHFTIKVMLKYTWKCKIGPITEGHVLHACLLAS